MNSFGIEIGLDNLFQINTDIFEFDVAGGITFSFLVCKKSLDHGVLWGQVAAVSPSAAQNETHEMVYHVKGTIEDLYFTIKGKMYPIKAGMTATAEIVTEKKSIFDILFKKFKKLDSVPK